MAEGLYEKEARAMVKTWESSWFAEQGTGTRLLYTVPRRVTDTILRLKITPTPDETVRVVVGRIDVLTPEQESKLAAMLPRAGVAGITTQEAREAQALGRCLRPDLQRSAQVQAARFRRWRYASARARTRGFCASCARTARSGSCGTGLFVNARRFNANLSRCSTPPTAGTSPWRNTIGNSFASVLPLRTFATRRVAWYSKLRPPQVFSIRVTQRMLPC